MFLETKKASTSVDADALLSFIGNRLVDRYLGCLIANSDDVEA